MRSLKPGFLPRLFRDNIDAKGIRQTEPSATLHRPARTVRRYSPFHSAIALQA